MKVVYTIPVRSGVAVPAPPSTPGLTVGATAVSWKSTDAGHLEAVILEFSGADIRYNENGAILPTYPELEEQAYRIANYLANRLYAQTGFDAIEANHVLWEAPVASPETPHEENEFKTKYKSIWKAHGTSTLARGLFDPTTYSHGFNHSAAYGYFSDASRAASEFQQFELLYKVVEYFFTEEGPPLDAAVSAHITPQDVSFTSTVVERLRLLRNRSVHPRAKKGHVNPQNIANVREIHAALPQMRHLASLLLAHPTF